MGPATNAVSVCCLARADELCRSVGAGAVYSFLNPDLPPHRLPRFEPPIRHRVYLLFDQERGRYAQQLVDATARFVDELAVYRPLATCRHTLFHCHGGVSRSTAACYIAVAMAYGAGQEAAAFRRLLEITEKPWPNLRMIEQADEHLKRQGRLVAPLLRYRERHPRRLAAYRRLNSTRGFLSTVTRDESLGEA